MTEQHMLDLLHFYQIEITAALNNYVPNFCTSRFELEHCFSMINPMRAMIYEKRYDKFNRWLGFMQGVFYCNAVFTIDQMRSHNRSYEEFIKETKHE